LLVCSAPVILHAANPVPTGSNSLCIMSYNLRYASSRPPNAWPERRPLMKEVINSRSPDLIGTQEGLFQQLNDLAADLPDYSWIGTGRDGGNKGEFMAIFYRKARFEPLATNHFWLSDTPEVPASSTWGNSNRRMVTWVRFLDRASRREFYHFNTHFDHEIQLAREKSAQLVRERVTALNTSLPVLLTGDFNAGAKNKAYELLVGDRFFLDTWDLAKERRGEGLGTFNNFRAVPQNNTRIDWILVRGPVTVDAEEIVTFSRDGHFPSDHCPLVTWLRLGE
jgi:endonuclease/exonuclease/phosphatase family metal-dependent hydrolase